MKKIRKKPNWEEKHFEFLLANKDRPFEWGKWDCILFCNAYMKQITGTDVLKGDKDLNKWKSEEEAMKAIKDYGKILSKAIARRVEMFDFVEIPKNRFNFLQKGDLVVYKEESELTGIFDGSNVLGPGSDGIKLNNSVKIVKAWRCNG